MPKSKTVENKTNFKSKQDISRAALVQAQASMGITPLEPRILLDAAAVVTGAEVLSEALTQDQTDFALAALMENIETSDQEERFEVATTDMTLSEADLKALAPVTDGLNTIKLSDLDSENTGIENFIDLDVLNTIKVSPPEVGDTVGKDNLNTDELNTIKLSEDVADDEENKDSVLDSVVAFSTSGTPTANPGDLIEVSRFNGQVDVAVTGGSFRAASDAVDSGLLNLTASGVIDLPNGVSTDNIISARLFWTGSGGPDVAVPADNQVTLNGIDVFAELTFADEFDAGEQFFGASADVTEILRSIGEGTFTVGGLQIDTGGNFAAFSTVAAGFTLSVVYEDSSIIADQTVVLLEGLDVIFGSASSPINATSDIVISNLDITNSAPGAGPEGRIITSVFEGDAGIGGPQETILINGTNVTPDGAFDSVSNLVGVNEGSQSFGVDIDQFSIGNLVNDGDTQISLSVSTGGDQVNVGPVALVFTNDGIPDAVNDSFATATDTALNITAANGVLANDIADQNSPITVTEINGTAVNIGQEITLDSGALVTLNADGSFDYDPNGAFDALTSNASTIDGFTYTVESGVGTDSASVTINLTAPTDTDGDGVADSIDVDDDNDGILDVNEGLGFDGDGFSDGVDPEVIFSTGRFALRGIEPVDFQNNVPDFTIVAGDVAVFEATQNDVPIYIAIELTATGGGNGPDAVFIDFSEEFDSPGITIDGRGRGGAVEFGVFTIRFYGVDDPAFDGLSLVEVQQDLEGGQSTATALSATRALSVSDIDRVRAELVQVNSNQLTAINTPTTANLNVVDNGTTTSVTGLSDDHGEIVQFLFEDNDEITVTLGGSTSFSGFFLDFRVGADADGDGILNHLDIDSDNDGITDNIEAQATNDFIAPSGIGADITDANMDGLDDNFDARSVNGVLDANASAATASDQLITLDDTDGDGTVDVLDTNSDNEGENDTIEAGLTGTATGLSTDVNDADGDGLFDVFDTQNGTTADDGFDVNESIATGAAALPDTDGDLSGGVPLEQDVDFRDVPTDTDGDGVEDFEDIDDDNDGILDVDEGLEIITDGDGFVDFVISFDQVGHTGPFDDPEQALGPPDGGLVSLGGVGSELVLGYLGAVITNSGDTSADLGFTEIGAIEQTEIRLRPTEATRLLLESQGELIADTEGFYSFGVISGSAPIDIDAATLGAFGAGELEFDAVKFVGNNDAGGPNFGPDIDAVEAFSLRVFNQTVTRDTDGDGIADHLDIDSDNDGITDNIEAQTTNGFIAPNADDAATFAQNLGLNSAYAIPNAIDFTDVTNLSVGTPSVIDTLTIGDTNVDVTANLIRAISADPRGDGQGNLILGDAASTDMRDPTSGDELELSFSEPSVVVITLETGEGNFNSPIPNASGDLIQLEAPGGFIINDPDEDLNIVSNEGDILIFGVADGGTLTTSNFSILTNQRVSAINVQADGDTLAPINVALLNLTGPVDTDGDGAADFVDTDSDNEGGNDTVEAGLTGTATGLSTDANDADGDGLFDVFDAQNGTAINDGFDVNESIATGALALPDTDGDASEGVPLTADVDFRDDFGLDTDEDGVADEFDIDDDNDGILDVNEIDIQSAEAAFGSYDTSGAFESLGGPFGGSLPLAIIWEVDGQTFTGSVFSAADLAAFLTANDPFGRIWTADGNDVRSSSNANDTDQDILDAYAGAGSLQLTPTVGFGEFALTTVRGIVAGSETVTVEILDSDGDGIINSLDIDSDNDGITDNIEAQTTNGFIAPTGTVNEFGVDLAYGTLEAVDRPGAIPNLFFDHNAPAFPGLLEQNNSEGHIISGSAISYGDGLTFTESGNSTSLVGTGHQTLEAALAAEAFAQFEITTSDDPARILALTSFTTFNPSFTGNIAILLDGEVVADFAYSNTGANFRDFDIGGNILLANDTTHTLQVVIYGAPNSVIVDSYGFNLAVAETLTAVDTDSDGTVDVLDTNSDNEGENDTIEAGLTGTATGLSTDANDADGDGLFDVFDTQNSTTADDGFDVNESIATGAAALPDTDGDVSGGVPLTADVDFRDVPTDTDGDGVEDFEDVDDDNDGILDVVEIGLPRLGAIDEGQTVANGNSAFFFISTTATIRDGRSNFNDPSRTADGSTNTGAGLVFDFRTAADEPNPEFIYGLVIGAGQTAETFQFIGNVGSQDAERVTNFVVEIFDENGALVFEGNTDDLADSNVINLAGLSLSEGLYTVRFEPTTVRRVDAAEINEIRILDVNGNPLPSTRATIPDNVELIFGRDSDQDGLADHLDIDSDNDGITDNIEAQTTTGFIAPSGIGAGITDVNQDGLDDNFDNRNVDNADTLDADSTAATTAEALVVPVDTDSDDTPDFRDSNSDNEGGNDTVEAGLTGTATGLSTDANDADGDGLFDVFDTQNGTDADDGFDVNESIATGAAALPDTDGDASGGVPLEQDVDFRDALSPPEAQDDAFEIHENPEGAEIGVITNGNLFADNGDGIDSDANGDSLSITQINGEDITDGEQITLASGALLTINTDGTFDYDPNGAFDFLDTGETGTDTFSYTLSDGTSADTDSATVTITISGDNDLPIIDLNGPDETGTNVVGEFIEDEAGLSISNLLSIDAVIQDDEDNISQINIIPSLPEVNDGDNEFLFFETGDSSVWIRLSDGEIFGADAPLVFGETTFTVAYEDGEIIITNAEGGSIESDDLEAFLRLFSYRNTSQDAALGEREFVFEVIDPEGIAIGTSTVTVSSLNDAPVPVVSEQSDGTIAVAGETPSAPALVIRPSDTQNVAALTGDDVRAAIAEGASASDLGLISVADLLAQLDITDAEDAEFAIGVIFADETQGRFQYVRTGEGFEDHEFTDFQLNDEGNLDPTPVPDGEALLLAADTYIRFIAAPGFDGTAGLEFRISDLTVGTPSNPPSTVVDDSGGVAPTNTSSLSSASFTLNLAADTDGDGIINSDDVDDDNDGILDVDEGLRQDSFAPDSTILTRGGVDTVVTGVETVLQVGDVIRYTNSITIDGQSIDAVITILEISTLSSNGEIRLSSNASPTIFVDENVNLEPFVRYSVELFEAGTNIAVTLVNPTALTFTDIDSGDNRDISEVVGIQSSAADSVELGDNLTSGGFVVGTTAPTGFDYFRLDPTVVGDVTDFVGEENTDPEDEDAIILANFSSFSSAEFVLGSTGSYTGNPGVARGFRVLDFTVTLGNDSDGDGIADHLDIDSDDDGITDNIEAQTTDGYIAPSGTGTGITDINQDGLDDNFDTRNGSLTAASIAATAVESIITPPDTDGLGNADFLDPDSDNDGISDAIENGLGVTFAPGDMDGDGLADVFEIALDGNANDGFIVNEGIAPLDGTLADSDNDAISGAIIPGLADLDFRDIFDTDGDGVADNRDIDDDNDGILDVDEGNVDTDGDGIINSLDIDSDNDGITDNVEAQTTAGYIAPSGQGNPDIGGTFVDVNRDGLDDNFDAGLIANGPANGIGLTPVNTDAGADTPDATPDFLDIDSDNDGLNDTLEAGLGTTPSTEISNSLTDADGDGLLDAFEDTNILDGFDVNDTNLDAANVNFNLPGVAGLNADGSNAVPLDTDLLFRDVDDAPVAENNVNVTDENNLVTVSGNIITDIDPTDGVDRDLDGDTLIITDIDGTSVATTSATDIVGQYGTLTVAADGTYSYNVDTTNGTVQGLGAGETLVESFTYTLSDGTGVDTATLSITINGSNDAPSLDNDGDDNNDPDAGTGFVTTFTENQFGATFIVDSDPVVTDAEENITEVSITLNGLAGDQLGINSTVLTPLGISAAIDGGVSTTLAADGSLTIRLSSPTPLDNADWEIALRSIQFIADTDTPERPVDTDRTVEIVLTDEDGAMSAPSITTINVIEINDIPDLDLDDDNSSGLNAGNAGIIFTENAGPVPITDGVVISDLDDVDIVRTVVALTNPQAGDQLFIGGALVYDDGSLVNPTGSVGDVDYIVNFAAGGQVEITFVNVEPIAAHAAALEAVSFNNTSDTPDITQRELDFVVFDREDNSITRTAFIDVVLANDAPVAQNDSETTDEDTVLSDNVLLDNGSGVDSDPDGDAISVTAVNGDDMVVGSEVTLPSGATLTLNANGTYDYNPNGAFEDLAVGESTTDSFTYEISDGEGGTDVATVTVTINGVNDGPVAQDDALTTTENGTLLSELFLDNGSGVDSDIDGDTIIVTRVLSGDDETGLTALTDGSNIGAAVAGSTGGLFTVLSNGTVSFDPGADFEDLAVGESRTSQIVYQIDDGNGGTDTAVVTVTVTGENDLIVPMIPGDPNQPVDRTDFIPSQTGVDSTPITELDLTAFFSDPDTSDVVTLTIVPADLPSGLTFDGTTISGTPDADASVGGDNGDGTYTIPVTVTDSNGDSFVTELVYTITNPAPVVDTPTGPQAGVDNQPLSIASVISDPDGDTLAYTVDGLPAGLVIDPNTGEITGTVDNSASVGGANDDGVYTVTVTANDNQGGTVTDTFELTITNPAPVAENDANSTTEDGPLASGNVITENDTDTDGDDLIVSEVGGDSGNVGTSVAGDNGGLFTINDDGSYSFDANGDFEGLDAGEEATTSITYQISDGEGGTDVATLTVTVDGVNDAPIVVDPNTPIPAQEGEDSTGVAPLNTAPFFSDVDGEPLTFTASNLPSGLVIDPNTGVISGTPDADASQGGDNGDGTYTVTVTATDPDGASVSTDVTYTITNPAPTADNDSFTTPEETSVSGNLIGNDNDPDGDDLVVDAVALADGTIVPIGVATTIPEGTLTVNANGSFTFDPALNFNGPVTFGYTVSDGQGGTDVATVNINVTPVNDTPIVVDPNTPIPAQSGVDSTGATPLNVAPFFSDIDGDTLSFTATNLPSGLVIDPVTGVVSGTPAANASVGGDNGDGTYTVTVTATDPDGASVSSDVTYTITNPVPIAEDDAVSASEDDSAATGSVFVNNGNGVDSDPDGDAINVSEVNGDSANVGTAIAGTNGGLFTVNNDGSYSFNANGDFEALDVGETATTAITYQISDGEGGTDVATLTVTVNGTNDAPIVTGTLTPQTGTDSVAQVPFDASTVFSDVDGESLAFTSTDLPSFMSLNPATGVITGTPPADASQGGPNGDGVYTVTVTATDPDGAEVSTTLTYSFTNPAPIVDTAVGPQAGVDGEPLSITPGIVDPDGDELAYTVDGLPTGLSIDPVTGEITGTVDNSASQAGPNGDGVYTITVTANDGEGGTVTDTFELTITNPVPDALDDVNVSPEDGPLASGNVITENDTDVDGDDLTVSEVNGDSVNVGTAIAGTNGGLFTVSPDGTYSFDANGDFEGLDVGENATSSITYQISDGEGGFDTATLTVTVVGANDAPTPVDPTDVRLEQSGDDSAELTPLDASELFSDPDAEINFFSLNGAPDFLSIDPFTGLITGTPPADASVGGPNGDGIYAVTVIATDPDGAATPITVTYTITNPAPVAENDVNSTTEDGPLASGNVITENDVDVDGDDLIVSEVNGDSANVGTAIAGDNGGLFTVNSDGSYSFDANSDFEGLDAGEEATTSITYQISDGEGGFDTATLTVTVDGVNDAPIVIDPNGGGDLDPIPAQEGEDSTGVTPLNTAPFFGDVDGEPLSFTASNLPSGLVIDQNTGVISGTPTSDASVGGDNGDGTYTVTVTATDPDGASVSTDVTYMITNPAPVVDTPIGPQAGVDGEPVSITSVISDPDGDVLAYTVDGLPAGLVIDPDTGEITGTVDNSASVGGPNGDGVYTVTVTADDNQGGTVTDTFELTITNPAPVAENDGFTTPEDTPLSGNLIGNDTDPDGDDLVVDAVALADGTIVPIGVATAIPEGTLTVNAEGTFTFEPALNVNGTVTFGYTVSDNQGGTDVATVTLNVTPVNDAPVPVDPTQPPVDPSDTSDPTDPDNPRVAPIDPNDFIPEQSGEDGQPIVPLDLTPFFGDPDVGDELTLSVDPADLPPGLVFDPVTGVISGTSDAGASQGGVDGVYEVSVTATDLSGESFTTTVTFDISNPPPVAVNDSPLDVVEDTPTVLDILGNDIDPDGDDLILTEINGAPVSVGDIITLPSGATLEVNADGSVTYSPIENSNDPDSFTYTISDGNGGFDTAVAEINIIPVNDGPNAIEGEIPTDGSGAPTPTGVVLPAQVNLDGEMIDPIDVSVAFEDVDGDPLTFNAEGLPPGLTIDPVTGVISGTLDNSASVDGPYNVTITATDPDGEFISTSFIWTVNNIAPEVTGTLELVNLTTVDVANIETATAFTDPDGDEFTFSAEGLPEGLTIDPDSGVISGVAFEEGVFMVTVTTDDGEGGQAEITLTLDVLQNGFIDVDPEPQPVNLDRLDGYDWLDQQSIELREFFEAHSLRDEMLGENAARVIGNAPYLGGMMASKISGLNSDCAYLVVEAVAQEHSVYVQLFSTLEMFCDIKVQDWDVRLGSGQSLPEGVNLQGDMIYIDRSVTRESVDLRVRAVLDNGRAVTTRATIDLATGTVTETGSASLALTSFSDQLAMSEDGVSVETDRLIKALG